MPKEAFEITKFNVGIATSPSSRDMLPNAAVHSENIDSLTEQGKLVPIPDQTNWINYTGTSFAEVPSASNERTLVVFDESNGNLNHVTDVYEKTGSMSLDGAIGQLSNVGSVNFVTHNNEVHIATKSSSSDVPSTPKVISYLDARTQFGANSTTGFQLFDAELHNPDDFITATVTESGTNADIDFDAGMHHYGFSVVYDEYQESPLYYDRTGNNVLQHSKVEGNTSGNAPGKSISVQVTVDTSDAKFTKRITAIRIYRGFSPSGFLATGFYRLVKEIDLSPSTGWTTNGNNKIYTFVDTNESLGASYDNNTGIPQTLESVRLDYILSTKLDNCKFAAHCYQPEIGLNESKTYIFKSKPYRLNTFDWTNDYVRIDFIPTAIIGYLGKLYVFGENTMLKINPSTLVIEDEFEGVGCLNQNCLYVTEYGLAIASDKNIYLHNGNTPAPIGDVINEGSNYSWQNRLSTYSPFILYEPKRNSLLFFFQTDLVQGDEQWAWVYNISQTRWDLYNFGNTVFKGGYNNRDGDVVVADANSLEKLLSSNTQKPFVWESGDMNMGSDSQRKIFFKIYVFGTGTIDVQYSVDKAALTSAQSVDTSVLTNEANGITLTPGASRKGKTIKVRVAGTNGEKVDSIVVVMRKLSIK